MRAATNLIAALPYIRLACSRLRLLSRLWKCNAMRPSRALWRAASRWKRLPPPPPRFQALSTAARLSPLSSQLNFFVGAKSDEKEKSVDLITTSYLKCFKQQRRKFLSCGDGDEDTGLSKQYEERRVIGYSPEQLFAVVAAVDLYEDFVPWCQKSTVLCRKGDESIDAELEIGFKFFVERYISHVELKRPTLIKTSVSQSSLFEYLTNIWEFKPGPVPGSCDLHVRVDFQFRSPLYRKVANMFFTEVVARLVSSFEGRCNTVYGPSTKILGNTYGSQTA